MARYADNLQNKALFFSGLLHLAVLLLIAFGLPEVWEQHREALPVATTVEVLPIGQTNIKPKAAPEPEKPKPEPKKPKPRTKERSASTPPKPEAVPMPKKQKKKPEPKPKKEPPKPKEEPQRDLSAILESVEKAAKRQPRPNPRNAQEMADTPTHFEGYNPDIPMAMSEIDAIRQQFMRCWNIPAGARNAHELRVVLDVRLSRRGEVMSVELAADRGRYYTDSFFRAAVDSAARAVHRCAPLRDLPPQKYETWKYLQLNFDPHDVLY